MQEKVIAGPVYAAKFEPLDPATKVQPFRRNEQPERRIVPMVSNANRSHAVEKTRKGGKVVWRIVF